MFQWEEGGQVKVTHKLTVPTEVVRLSGNKCFLLLLCLLINTIVLNVLVILKHFLPNTVMTNSQSVPLLVAVAVAVKLRAAQHWKKMTLQCFVF